MKTERRADSEVQSLRAHVAELGEALEHMERERDRLVRRRRRQVLVIGIGVSLVAHLGIMAWLASQYRIRSSGGGSQPVSFEFALLQDAELTELELDNTDDVLPEVLSDLTQETAETAMSLDPAVPSVDLDVSRAGALPTLGGSGGGMGVDGSLSGGGAATSFFGIGSRGSRFAFIVDRSGSMGQDRKMRTAMRELARSIGSLPDYASFHVILFSTDLAQPPMQKGWMRARKSTVNRLIRWLGEIDPGGGTQPWPAFVSVFALDVRPDVIFFLTDGEIPEDTADLLADLNRRGGRVVVNTIAFGDARSQEQLKRISAESGGLYKFVRTDRP